MPVCACVFASMHACLCVLVGVFVECAKCWLCLHMSMHEYAESRPSSDHLVIFLAHDCQASITTGGMHTNQRLMDNHPTQVHGQEHLT